MEKMTDLRALLAHEAEDLVSAEEQIIKALPAMIEKAKNPLLKKSLQQHLRVTEQQLKRIQKVQKMLEGNGGGKGKNKGILGGLFGGGKHECKGIKGIIEEGNRTMGEDMNSDVMDAAIIASAQKVEHYEICGYGTAKAFAEELGLTEVTKLLEQTLNEEYDADITLTELAVNRVNVEAETEGESEETPTARSSRRSTAQRSSETRSSSTPSGRNERTATSGRSSANGRSGNGQKSTAKKSAPKKAQAKKGRTTSKSR